MLHTNPADLYETLSQIQVPITVSDVLDRQTFKFIAINPAHTEHSGVTRDALLGQSPHDVLPEDEANLVSQRYAKAVETGRTHTYQERLSLPAGQQWWKTSVTPIKSGDGQVLRLCVSSVPIDTEMKLRQLTRDLHMGLEELEAVLPTVTSGVEGALLNLLKLADQAQSLAASGEVPLNDRITLRMIDQIARLADEHLKRARANGLDEMGNILDRALLKHGTLADMIDDHAAQTPSAPE